MESEVFETLNSAGLEVFSSKDLSLLLNFNKTKTYNVLKTLKKKQVIETISSGLYCFKSANEFVVGTVFNNPSYLSFLSALNYYGFSDNLPKKITFVSTKYKKHKKFQYVCLSKKRYFGYKKEGDVVIGEKEKIFVDSLLFPKYSGGIKEVSRILIDNLNELNIDKLISHTLKVNSKMVIRRLGFILKNNLDKKRKKILLDNIGKGVGFLDPNIKRKNNLNSEWLLYTNLE